MARKKRSAPGSDGPTVPEWIVTFSDMVSLLVTFFILLLTFSSLEDDQIFARPTWVIGFPGALENDHGPSATPPPDEDLMQEIHDRRGADVPHSRPTDELASDLDRMGQEKREDHAEIDLADVHDGIVVRYDERASFAPGSAELTPWLAGALGELARVLEHYRHLVVVEGFTDDRFEPTPTYPDAEALSLARARAAARVLLQEGRLSPKLVQVAGHGARRPVASNETARSRAANRRVEIRILSLSTDRAEHVEALRSEERR